MERFKLIIMTMRERESVRNNEGSFVVVILGCPLFQSFCGDVVRPFGLVGVCVCVGL